MVFVKVSFELELSPIPVMVYADSNRLCQVIVNLVNNAVKYSPEHSPVQVGINQYQCVAIIQVSDAGSGIPKEQQEHIFEPFYRTPDVQTSAKSGLGLGLAICKDIVERHGGRIWCDSCSNKGSCFFVELPWPDPEQ